MAFQITERPHKFSFSKNPVRYVFNITNPETPGSALEIELYGFGVAQGVNDAELINKQTLFPNPDGTVYFYCEDFLHSFTDWELPNLSSNDVLAITKQIKKYFIKYRQVTTQNPSPVWVSDEDNIRTLIRGGVAKEKFDRNNYFLNHLPVKKNFLTWQPDGHKIGLEERRYLTYFHDDEALPALLLKARVVYLDGAEDSTEKAFPALEESLLFHCPAGLQQLGLYNLQPDKQVWYYDVSVEDADGNVYAAPYRMYADYDKYYDVFSFIFGNSLGGIDTLRIRGDYDVEIILSSTEIEQATGGDFSTAILPTENTVVNISKYDKYTGDAGWMNKREQQQAAQELLLSDAVYRVVFGRWLRVMNLAKSQQLAGKADTKFSFPLQWRYTFDNSQFTPEAVDLGAGVNDSVPGLVYGTCTAPSNLAVAFVEDVPGGKKYTLSWDDVADAVGYESILEDEDGNVVDEQQPVGNSVDVVIKESGNYSWRVRTKCGDNDFSGYSNGPGFNVLFNAVVCAAPDSLDVILMNIDSQWATIKFTWPAVPGVVGYIIEWRELGTSVWQTRQTNLTYAIIAVKPNVQFEQRVRSQCDNVVNYSGYTYGQPFIPSNMIGTCNAPTNLTAAVVIDTIFAGKVVSLKWTAAVDVDSYQVQYREQGTLNWTTKDDIATTETMLAFIPKDKTWEWRMRSNCTGGGFSNFVNGPDFNT